MFNEVDEDGNGSVSWDEFLAFWKNVVGSGYSEEDLLEEVRASAAAVLLLLPHTRFSPARVDPDRSACRRPGSRWRGSS